MSGVGVATAATPALHVPQQPLDMPMAAASVSVPDSNIDGHLIAMLALIFFHAFCAAAKSRKPRRHPRQEKPACEELHPNHESTNESTSKPAESDALSPTAAAAARAVIEPMLNAVPATADGPLRCQPLRAPLGALPPEVADSVRALRAKLEARLEHWSSAVRAEAEAQLDDLTLGRWAVAFPQGAEAAFESAMKWRAESGPTQLMAELHPVARTREGRTARQAAVQEYGYAGIGGLTRDGLPYMIERMGKADFGGYARQGEAMMQLMRDAYVAHLELMTRAVRAAGAATGTFAMGLVVIDTKGVGASLLFNLALVKFAAKVGPPQPPCNPSP